MSDIQTLDHELNEQILQGKILEAFDRFYAEDVIMQEHNDEPTRGHAANRAREIDFLNSVAEFHGVELKGAAVNGETSFSEWLMDLTFQGGQRVSMQQVSVRRWRDGKVIHERFYYNPG
jgi:ketosteroid isomerase-like protein